MFKYTFLISFGLSIIGILICLLISQNEYIKYFLYSMFVSLAGEGVRDLFNNKITLILLNIFDNDIMQIYRNYEKWL